MSESLPLRSTGLATAVIELRDLQLKTDIGTYGPEDVKPDVHVLDLTLGIDVDQVSHDIFDPHGRRGRVS